MLEENYRVIKENIRRAAESVGKREEDIILLAATKTVDAETVNRAIRCGVKYIGENRVQEFLQKEAFYDKSAHRHFIGHLQTNKAKDIVGRVELIHSVDSLHLAKEISKAALKKGIVQDVLLEVNIGNEESKSGFKAEELTEAAAQAAAFEGLRIKGLMAIPPVCEKPSDNIKYFDAMYKLFIDNALKKIDNSTMEILSMGMSGDYECAVKCGANLVRIGTSLFGRRIYK